MGGFLASMLPTQVDRRGCADVGSSDNPERIIAFNNGMIYSFISLSEHEDFTAGETNDPALVRLGGNRFANGRIDGAYPHMRSLLGSTWGKGPPRFTDDQVIEWTRNLVGKGAAVTWDAPIQPGGLIAEPFLKQLGAIGKALARR